MLDTLKLTGGLKPLNAAAEVNPVYDFPAFGCAASAANERTLTAPATTTAMSLVEISDCDSSRSPLIPLEI